MSLFERIDDGTQEIEQGKRLIRVGDDRNIPFSDRLSYRLSQLGWLAPLHHLRVRNHSRLRLLSVPKDPIAGDKAAGEALLGGTFVHGHETVPVETLNFDDPNLSPALFDYLHSFEWLRDLAAAATRERGARLAERLVHQWLGSDSAWTSEGGWRPELWGRRVLFWTAYAPYILSARDVTHRAAVLMALGRGARHLEGNADKAPFGLGRITAWTGMIASALLLQGGTARLRYAESGLARALAAALHDDGGLVSRSPLEQLALVEVLSQLRAVYYAGHRDVPERIAEALAGAVAALLSVTLGDEALSSWQGASMVSRRRLAAAVEGSAVTTRPLRQARGWGYQRLAAKESVVIFDGAPPPAARWLAGGCASTLAFEFSEGPSRLVVNCGGVKPLAGTLPRGLVHALRYTAAHSTLTLGDRNSTAIHQDGALGKGVRQVELSRDETGGISRLEASHDGYVRRFGFLHERELILAPDGRELRGEDRLLPQGRKKRREGPLNFAVRFHLGPDVEVTSTADGQGALLRIRGSTAWQFRCRGGTLSIEDSLWVDGKARTHATSQLVIVGETPAEGLSIAWQFHRAA